MVIAAVHDCLAAGLLAATKAPGPVLEQLDPKRRVAVIMTIIAIVVTGLILMTCTMLGARWVRGLARQKPRPPRLDPTAQAAAENRTLRASLEGILPNVDPDETIHTNRKTGDTKVDP